MTHQQFLDRILRNTPEEFRERSGVPLHAGAGSVTTSRQRNTAEEADYRRFLRVIRGEEQPPKQLTGLEEMQRDNYARELKRVKQARQLAERRRCTVKRRLGNEVVEQLRSLKEACSCDGAKIGKGIIKNVLVLSANSRNGRRYERSAMQKAIAMYDGAKVNIDHPLGNPSATRSLRDRVGKLTNVRLAAEGIRADLVYNPHSATGKQLAWWAANAPDCLGMSHNAVGSGHDDDGVFVVEEIVALRSVDLVADPATTSGLFS